MKRQNVGRIPRLHYWHIRLRAYRTKYGLLRAIWKAIILSELAFFGPTKAWAFKSLEADELALISKLVEIKLDRVEYHLQAEEE